MTLFEKRLREASQINSLQTHYFTSLTPSQKQTLNEFKHSKEFIVNPTDKNLGPVVMNRDEYISQVLKEHLLTPTYQQLDPNIAHRRILQTKERLIDTLQIFRHQLTKPEIDFFTRSLKEIHRTPIFYGMKELLHLIPCYIKNSTELIKDLQNINLPKGTRLQRHIYLY
jgi:hypothetical protein